MQLEAMLLNSMQLEAMQLGVMLTKCNLMLMQLETQLEFELSINDFHLDFEEYSVIF